jgi:hypothetical protein
MAESNKKLYDIWHGMCRRCHDPRRKDYYKYGARGIKVCESWRGSSEPNEWTHDGYTVFMQWAMSHGYRDGMTLDRVSNGRGYAPNNCRWISKKAQAYNRKTNTYLTVEGVTRTLTQWASERGIPDYVICKRLAAGWDVERAVMTPKGHRKKRNKSEE